MDTTLYAVYIATIDYGLTLPNREVQAYYVTNGDEHHRGPLHAVLRWHRDHAETDPTAVSPWALASVANCIAEALEP